MSPWKTTLFDVFSLKVDESYTIGTGKFAVVHMCHRRSQPERKYALKASGQHWW